jgi:hypothetical protein
MNSNLTVTTEAVQATRALRSQVIELHKDLLNATKGLVEAFAENQRGLGAHSESIKTLLENLATEGTASGEPVKKLTRKLKVSADIRQANIDNPHYKTR